MIHMPPEPGTQFWYKWSSWRKSNSPVTAFTSVAIFRCWQSHLYGTFKLPTIDHHKAVRKEISGSHPYQFQFSHKQQSLALPTTTRLIKLFVHGLFKASKKYQCFWNREWELLGSVTTQVWTAAQQGKEAWGQTKQKHSFVWMLPLESLAFLTH